MEYIYLFKISFIKNVNRFYNLIRLIIICLLLLNYFFNQRITNIYENINFIKECNKIEDYLKLCNNKLIKIKKEKEYKYPKISIVSPIYNRGKYLLRFIKSIQNQKFKDIEITY